MSRPSAILAFEAPDTEFPDLPQGLLATPANDSVKLAVRPLDDVYRAELLAKRPIGTRLGTGGLVAVASIGLVAAAGAIAMTIGWLSTTDHAATNDLSLSLGRTSLTAPPPPSTPTSVAISSSDFTEGLNALRSQIRASQVSHAAAEAQPAVAPPVKAETSVAPADPVVPVTIVASASPAPPQETAVPTPGLAPALSPGSAPSVASDELQAMLGRAKGLIAVGDIAAARRLTEYAAGSGNAEAIFILAETFDPRQLQRWRVRGVRADLERARSLYRQALQQGVAEAQTRLAALR